MKAFIIFRDRVTYARRCQAALGAAGLDVVVIDSGSTWPEAVQWLTDLETAGTTVLRRGGGHPHGLWQWPPFQEACGSARYVVTDPDVVPSDDCPGDWLSHLSGVLDEFPQFMKAGLGLRLDRIPEDYLRRAKVLEYEEKYWQSLVSDRVYDATIDTTLALYRPLSESPDHAPVQAARTGSPYVADHLAWYEDHSNLPAELRHYYEHIESGISFWTSPGKSYWGD